MSHMQRLLGSWLAAAITLLLGLSAVLLTACDLSAVQPTATPVPATPTPEAPSEPTPSPTEVIEGTPTAPSSLTLTLWMTEAFSPTEAITSGQILRQELASFEESHPDVSIQVIIKKPYGKGGILDFLLATEAVVPTLLPDVALVDTDELGTAAQAGVIQPLDGLISPDLVADLYPFARQACTLDGQLYGLQFQADLDHLVYNTGKLSVPPRSWPGVLSNPGPYIFPAGGQAGLVNDDFLIQYLAVRPWPSADNTEGSFLEAEALTAVLQYYQDGLSRGVFPAEILDYQTTDDCWRVFQAGETALTHVAAHRYLAERDLLTNSAIAPIPAINGAGAAISRGWALTLVATDPARQALAVELMAQLMSPQTNAAWNHAANYLPTRQTALVNWEEEDSYARFAAQQLQSAQAYPRLTNSAQVSAAMQEAVEEVLTGAATPEEAAAAAIEKVQ